MIAFASFCTAHEISGVSTWLEKLLIRCHTGGIPVSLLLHGLGARADQSPTYRSLREAGVPVRFTAKPQYTEDGMVETFEYLNEFRPSLFVPNCLEHFYYAADRATQFGLPWVFTIHSDDPVYWAVARTLNLQHPLSSTVGVSRYICQRTLEQMAIEPTYIPYGVSHTESQARFCRSPFRIIYCGRIIEEQKRIRLVIETMEKACRQASNVECLLIGDGSQLLEMKDYVAQAGLSTRMRFAGRLEAAQLQREMLNAQAILLMSDYEGLPMALLEAMAVGVVPIVRRIEGGIPELLIHEVSGLVVDDDPASASAEVVRLANHPDLWATCSKGARQIVDTEFSDDRSFEGWQQMLLDRHATATATFPLSIPADWNLKEVPAVLTQRDQRKRASGKSWRRRFMGLLKPNRE